MPKTSHSAREQLLETAARLFFQQGYRAVGVDTIVAESGVGKMTLYRHFPSKDDLILAYLHECDDKFWSWFDESTEPAREPRAKLLAFFRALATQVGKPTCYGCPFLNVATEFPELDHPGHQVALAHKRAVLARFQELAKQMKARKPNLLAEQLLLLMEGAFMAARVYGPANPAARVAQAAETLIDVQFRQPKG